MELYKKHRPATLRAIVGNEDTVSALQNMIEKKTLPHTILFHGEAGCGKTTLARILKKELNCHDFDFQECNSANFRGIDAVRNMERQMNMASVGGPCRIFLLDEVHKLTDDGQTAALKMLEDTPRHVYFFLCTTHPQKLVKAIRTRCCEMPVRLLTFDEMEFLLNRVVKREKANISKEAILEIATCAQGSARTGLVLLDKILNLEPKDQMQAIQQKIAEENQAIDLCRALIKKESWGKITGILKGLKQDPEAVRWSVLGYARSVLLNKVDHQAYLIIDCFKNNFYDSKDAGLIQACFEAIHSNN